MPVNWLAIGLATLASFIVGGIWYSPGVFGRKWMAENHFNQDDVAKRKMARVFGLSFFLSLVMATNLAFFLGKSSLRFDVLASLGVGIGWIAPAFGVVYTFEKKSIALFLINAGYHVVSLLVMGLIIGMLQR
jgi:Protein of unknown function (DUF1761)